MNRRPGSGCRTATPVRPRHGRGVLQRIVGVGREPDGDLELDRIGVLELVEQHAGIPVVQEATDVGVAR